ncbi:hypothetical protein PR048_016324 [Dryococelus australis]|uniref:HTH psq-type domain-containing protein n=1 Tax=Dryococelus australis TaxID=614101 RepID=A0ABQ9HJQ3_9NEOP|nr:hypothetical protein PR048_016324 [Dryococelus australis]
MVRNYKTTFSRGKWDKNNIAAALLEVKEGRMSCLGAAIAYHIPEVTLLRRLNTNVDELQIHCGRFREVFSEQQLEYFNNYITAMEKILRKSEATSISRPMGFHKPSVDRFFLIFKELRENIHFLLLLFTIQMNLDCPLYLLGYQRPFHTQKRMLPELVERATPETVGHCSDNRLSIGEIFVLFFKHFDLHVKCTIISSWLDFHPTPLYVSFFGPLKTYYSQACDNFMVSHPGQAITGQKVNELLSIAYFKAATVGNAVNSFKECGIEPYDPLCFNEHDFAAAKTTDHVLVTDNAESENATAQIAAPRGQHTETPNESHDEHEAVQNEEPGHSGNAVSVKSKPRRSIFDFKPLPKERPLIKNRKSHSQCASVITSTPMKEILVQKEAQKVEK